jgi:hypothetical protein
MRAQFAFLGVARPDEHELCRMTDRQPFAFDDIFTRLCHIKQQVDDVILQKVYLVKALLHKLCAGDSSHDSSVIAGVHEQLDPYELQDQKWVTL